MHQTKNLDDGYFGSGKLIQRAVKKHGIDNFHKEILYVYNTEDKMKLAEKILVVPDQEINYNLCSGGMGGFDYINKNRLWDNEARYLASFQNAKKGSIKFLELIKNEEFTKNFKTKIIKGLDNYFKNNGRKSFLGKKHSEETKQIMRYKAKIHQKGSKNSQFGTIWVTNGQKNKKIKKELLDTWIEKGYCKGRKL